MRSENLSGWVSFNKAWFVFEGKCILGDYLGHSYAMKSSWREIHMLLFKHRQHKLISQGADKLPNGMDVEYMHKQIHSIIVKVSLGIRGLVRSRMSSSIFLGVIIWVEPKDLKNTKKKN